MQFSSEKTILKIKDLFLRQNSNYETQSIVRQNSNYET